MSGSPPQRLLVTGAAGFIAWQPRETGDVTRTLADVSAARAALGWSPRVSFEEGIRRFAGWLRASR